MRLTPVGYVALAHVLAVSLQAQSGSNVFPMEKGTSWIYTGSVAWQEEGPLIHRMQLSWKAEVLDSVERGRFRIALLLGDPKRICGSSSSTVERHATKRVCRLETGT
jgi:hypothetical protein